MAQLPKKGNSAKSTVTYIKKNVALFSKISGDVNPVHLDAMFAKNTIFKKPIVHGIYVASQISALIANELPGPGSIYLHQELNFLAPVFHSDIIECVITVIEVKPEKNIVILQTTCTNNVTKVKVIDGKAVIKLL